MPANTGVAGAMHRVGFFAGMPAPTGPPQPSRQPQYLWERVHPRTPAQPVPATAPDSSRARPLPQDYHNLQGSRSTCGGMPANTGAAGAMHRVGFFAGMPAPTGPPQPSRQPPYLWERVHPRTPAQPVPATALDASRVNPLPQGYALSMVITCADPGLPQAAPRFACRHQPSCLPPANHHPPLRS